MEQDKDKLKNTNNIKYLLSFSKLVEKRGIV